MNFQQNQDYLELDEKSLSKVIDIVRKLKDHEIKKTIDQRMEEFSSLGKKSNNEIYKELCFCFLTANFNAEKSIKMQNEINDGFLHQSEEQLAQKLAELGHRFPNARANYIFLSREHKDTIKDTLQKFEHETQMRDWIVENIKGIGMKEASHFLRNVGYKDVAIIDFHIVDLLAREGLIEKPKNKSLTPKKYIEIERVLNEVAKGTNTSLGELDLYLWFEETGTVLK